jgi:hypothetical protein
MTLRARVVKTVVNAAMAFAETIARAVNAASFAETGVATAVRAAILAASVARVLVAREAENAATFAPKAEKIARAVISVGNAEKALVVPEVVVISAVDLAAIAAFKVHARPVKVASALDREMDLVLPATGTGNPVQQTTKKTTLSTGFTR